MRNNSIVYSKSGNVTLKEHVHDCMTILNQLRLCIPNIPVGNTDHFWEIMKCCVVFHDMGKSHAEFQKLLLKEKNKWNGQRHELFSIPYVFALDVCESEKCIISYVVVGHHKTIKSLYNFTSSMYREELDEFDILDESIEVGKYKEEMKSLNYDYCYELAKEYGYTISELTFNRIFDYIKEIYVCNFVNKVGSDEAFNNLLLVGGLKQCDHLASAGIAQLRRIKDENFGFLLKNTLYHHQEKSYSSNGNTLLIAPTGSGKTESSLLWVKHNYLENGEGRIFYVLPYTASINAMYERLNNAFGEQNTLVGMLHGKLAQYLETIIEEKSNDILIKNVSDYRTMVNPLKIVTPFQLLKNLFMVKGYEKGIFEWCGGYFIFDEIHAYDMSLFAQIVVLIQLLTSRLNAKIFIMSATIPTFLTKELLASMNTCAVVKADLEFYERLTRHRVIVKEGLLRCSIDRIKNDIKDKKKVLVVCNTVEESQFIYSCFNDFDTIKKDQRLLLHGAFNSNDRSNKEKQLHDNKTIMLLVGTQAIEVSLDMDFDVIYTEPAPLDALLQRLGRVNRKAQKDICNCYVFNQRNEADRFVYKNEDVINRTLSVLSENENKNKGIIYEKNVQELIDQVYPEWESKDKEEYDLTKSWFETATSFINALDANEIREKEFYDQFDSVKALPVSLLKDYLSLMQEQKFIKAEGLMVNISKRRFHALLRNEQIKKDRICYDYKDNRLFDKKVFIIKKKYSQELGLLLNEDDNDVDNLNL